MTLCTTCGQPRLARWVSTTGRAVAVRRGRAVRIGPPRAAVLGLRYECACASVARSFEPALRREDRRRP